jgi:endonuclease/exonuclease/phosphatase family metal-dependent hydrolase
MATILRVATINIYRDRSRWPERRTLLARGLADLSLDLIALQEVTDPLGSSTAHWLANELGGYTVHVCPKAGSGRKHEGIAVLSRLPVEGHEILDLRGQQRTAQFVRVRAGGQSVVLVNGHYYWPVGAHSPQARQVGLVLDRVGSFDPGTAVIVCGDFNATPKCRSIALMRRDFISAHQACHGREPDSTCPTPLISGGGVRRVIVSGLCRWFSIVPSDIWRGTLDYIFVSPGVGVVECSVILDRPSPGDPTLYASDHFGLAATLEIPAVDPPGPGNPTPSMVDGP